MQHQDFQALHNQMQMNPQTPNSFLASLPKLHMEEINQFESAFKSQNQPIMQEASPSNEVMSMDNQQQMMESIAAAFNNTTSQQMMLPMTPDSYTMAMPTQNNFAQMPTQWNAKRRPSFLADQSLGAASHDFGMSAFQMPTTNEMVDFSNSSDMQSSMSQAPKRARSQSLANIHSINRPEAGEDVQRLSFLERNRKAAMKCRQKKKNYLINLEQKVEALAKENKRLHDELSQFKAMAGLS